MRPTATWDSIRAEYEHNPIGTETKRLVCRWIIDALERRLGSTWPARAAAKRSLGGVNWMLNSAPELLDHLTLALRLEDTWDVPNRTGVVRALISDFAEG
jgi:hypothetical protein